MTLGGPRVVVGALAATSLLQWLGASAVLPLLPLYLEAHGAPATQVGVVMAAYFVGAVAAQYAAGRAGDLLGHRRVLVVGLVGYAVASAAFLLPLGGWTYAVLRAAQGAAAGAAEVSVLALVARAVRPEVRGRAFSAVYGGQLAGVAVGPLAGSAVGIGGMGELFAAAGILALVACLPVLALLPRPPSAESEVAVARAARLTLRGPRGRVLAGVVLVAVSSGTVVGVYEATWSLLLQLRGASAVQIGVSWTLFALPYAVLVPLGGWLADRVDRRGLVLTGMLVAAALAGTYPWLPSVGWLLGLGTVEAAGVALAVPAAQSLVADAAPVGATGRAQAVYATAQTAATAAAASASGALFAVAAWLPFDGASLLGCLLACVVVVAWRGVPGHVARTAAVPPGVGMSAEVGGISLPPAG